VRYEKVNSPIHPKSHIDRIRPLLPEKYSPLKASGDGNEVYLAELPPDLATLLIRLLEEAGNEIVIDVPIANQISHRDEVITQVEQNLVLSLEASQDIGATEREQIVKARRGQGRFRENVRCFERCCRVSGIADDQFLNASHIKPWKDATNQERLD